jgi:GNAT superfamily N-acetyltransferase
LDAAGKCQHVIDECTFGDKSAIRKMLAVSPITDESRRANLRPLTLSVISSPSAALLAIAYRDVLQRCFTRPGELDDLADLQSYLSSSSEFIRYRLIVATVDSITVGVTAFALFLRRTLAFATSEYTAVAPSWRGRGIGQLLATSRLRWCRIEAKRAGYRDLGFSVVALEPTAESRSFWQRIGYRTIDFP